MSKFTVTILGLAILLAGIVIGNAFMPAHRVYAQSPTEEVTPNMRIGTALFNTALAHRVVADQVIVGDHDMGKLLEGLMNLMSRKSAMIGAPVYTQAELQAVINNATLDRPIRVAPTQATGPATKPPLEDKK